MAASAAPGTKAQSDRQLLYGLIIVLVIVTLFFLLIARSKRQIPGSPYTNCADASGVITAAAGVQCAAAASGEYTRYNYLPDVSSDPLTWTGSESCSDGCAGSGGCAGGLCTCATSADCLSGDTCVNNICATPACTSAADCSANSASGFWACNGGVCMSSDTLAALPSGGAIAVSNTGLTTNTTENVCQSACEGSVPGCAAYAYEDAGPPVCTQYGAAGTCSSPPAGSCTYFSSVPGDIATVASDAGANSLPRYIGIRADAISSA